MMLLLKDLLDSEKSENSLHNSSISEPTEPQDTSFGIFQGDNHSGGSRKKKMALDSTDPEIMIEKQTLNF
jgi:hypothetical protein